MKIAILAPPWFAVPPSGYGGIEWIVWLLADGLADQGHDVTLFASGDSHTKAKLEAVFEHAPSELIGRSLPELRHVLACYDRADEFDVINDHTGHLGAVLGGVCKAPVVHTVHGPLDGEPGLVYRSIQKVAPKVELLQNARTTLFPIEWEEPFGLVMIESMACGTPVIATRFGAVPEVMGDGQGGIVVDQWREIPEAIARADEIDPLECRRYVEERFAPERMVGGQRGWKRQPLGIRTASGASPLRISRFERSRGSRRGTTESSAFVYGCCGSRMTDCAGPSSTIRPRYMTAMRSAKRAAVERSCVIIRIPRPASRRRSSRFRIPARTETSSIETGSSATSRSGPRTMLAAIATRCRWPPESSCG